MKITYYPDTYSANSDFSYMDIGHKSTSQAYYLTKSKQIVAGDPGENANFPDDSDGSGHSTELIKRAGGFDNTLYSGQYDPEKRTISVVPNNWRTRRDSDMSLMRPIPSWVISTLQRYFPKFDTIHAFGWRFVP